MRHIIALSLLIAGIVSSCSNEPQSFNFGPGPNDGEDESDQNTQNQKPAKKKGY